MICKVSKYNDGTPIPLLQDNEDWKNTKEGAYCIYNGEYLYNWYALDKLAPKGWKVPTDEDWDKIEIFPKNLSGFRSNNGSFNSFGFRGTWWSATESSASFAYHRYLYYYSENLYRDDDHKGFGFSVVLIRV
jgi:hypothetical protein